MAVKPVSRRELMDRILDPTLQEHDKELAARALVRNFPAITRTLDELVGLVCPMLNPTAEVFDVLSDAHREAHPKEA